ncbi:MAG: transporter substrate-binding domain-containing protein [Marinobacter sp.]|nr:transporter substrate-binding domain-containing protein [Marinobacter sp.]
MGLVLVWGATAQAEDVLLVTGNNYPPFADESLPEAGVLTALVRAVFERMGYQAHMKHMPWNRAQKMVLDHDALGTFPYVRDAEREQRFLFSEPLYIDTEVYFVRADAAIQFQRPADLRGLKLCRPVGYSVASLQPVLENNLVDMWTTQDLETCFRLLEFGRIQLVPIGRSVGRAQVAEQFGDPDYFPTLDPPISHNGLHLMIAKDYPGAEALIRAFNQQLRDMEADGTKAALFERHHHPLSSSAEGQ